MSLNGTWNTPAKQFKEDVIEDYAPPGKHLAPPGTQGLPGYMASGNQEHEVDLILEKIRVTPQTVIAPNWFKLPPMWFPVEEADLYCECVGMHLICPNPSCGMSLFVDCKRGMHTVYIHWDDMRRGPDGYYRPTVTVDRPFTCDYSYPEINGIASPRSAIINKCGWRVRVAQGRLVRV